MAKIFTDDEIRFLSANPNVRVIAPKRLSLTYEFRCQLYDAWGAGGRAAIRSTLEAGGIPCKMVGRNVITHLCFNYRNDLTEEETPEPTPSEDPNKDNDKGNTGNNGNDFNKVETGNYADSAVFVGMLGAVIAAIGIILYLKKKNQDSEA